MLLKNLFVNFYIDSTWKTNKRVTAIIQQHSLHQHTASSEFNSCLHTFNRQSFASSKSDKSFSIRTNYVILRFVAEVNSVLLIVCSKNMFIIDNEACSLIIF